MNSNRKSALIVGILYIIGTVAGILSVAFTSSLLTAPDYLVQVSANENSIVIGALFLLLMGLSLAMVPVVLFPILKNYNETLALGYVVFRGALETFTSIATALTWFLLLIAGQAYINAGAPANSSFQVMGALLLAGGDAINPIMVIVFSLGALMLYYMFYTSNLIPRWLSVWGIIAILMHFTTGFLIMFHLQSPFSTLDLLMNFPIFLQEMVMAVWLILKGFNSAPISAGLPRGFTTHRLSGSEP